MFLVQKVYSVSFLQLSMAEGFFCMNTFHSTNYLVSQLELPNLPLQTLVCVAFHLGMSSNRKSKFDLLKLLFDVNHHMVTNLISPILVLLK